MATGRASPLGDRVADRGVDADGVDGAEVDERSQDVGAGDLEST